MRGCREEEPDYNRRDNQSKFDFKFIESIVNTVREPLVVLDAELRIISANSSFYRTFHAPPEETEGKLIYEICNRIWDIPELRRLLGEILPENTSFNDFEVEADFPEIGKRTMLLNACRIYQDGEKTEMILLAIEDFTEKKKAEHMLLESEFKFRQFFENSPEYCYMVSSDGKILDVNKTALKALGYRKDELVGNFMSMVYAPEYYGKWRQLFEVWRQTGEVRDEEMVIVSKNGKRRNVLLSASAVRDIEGNILHSVSVQKDITDRKKIEEALKESEKRYRTTFEHTGTAMAIIEEDTTLSLVNSEFERLSGYSKEEIEGKMSWMQFVHPEDLERMKEYHILRRKGREVPKKYEFRSVDRQGNVRSMFLTIDVIPGTKRSVVSLIDITYLKKLDNLIKGISEINEVVARERNPEIVLKTVCEKLTFVYDAVFTSLRKGKNLVPVESKGISLKSIKNAVKSCPSILRAFEGEIAKMKMDSKLCRHCTTAPHNFVLSIPLVHENNHGVVTIHSTSDFNEDEIKLLEKLSRNIAFALSAYSIEEDRKQAFEQLTRNLMQFEKSADGLRNPLAIIMGSLELISEIGVNNVLELIKEQTRKMKFELDRLRKEELETFRLTEKSTEI